MKRSKIWIVLCAGMFAVSGGVAGSVLAGPKPAGQQPATTTQGTATETEVIPQAEPAKVKELAVQAGVTTEQVNTMRTSGLGWGEVKIAISLAQKISTAETPALEITPILNDLLAQRESGMGWGEIAQANGYKLGEIVGKGQAKKDATVAPTEPAPTTSATVTGVKPERGSKIDKPAKPEKAGRLDRVERPEKPEKPEKPARAEKPERPEKPEKPHRHAR